MLLSKFGRTAISYRPPQDAPCGAGRGGCRDRTWAILSQCSVRDWETPSTSEEGSLETVGFKLTFAYFCSAAKVGRRRPEGPPSGQAGSRALFAPASRGPASKAARFLRRRRRFAAFPLAGTAKTAFPPGCGKHQNRRTGKNVLPPATGCPLWGGKRRMQRPDLGDILPILRQRLGDPRNVRKREVLKP